MILITVEPQNSPDDHKVSLDSDLAEMDSGSEWGFSSAGDPVPPVPSEQPPSPPAEPPPKPSKRLIIVAECKWASKADRSFVLKDLCERMAWDQLEKPFWIKKYMINPVGQTVEESSTGRCIQYKIHITRPSEDPIKPAEPVKPVQPGTERETQQEQVGNRLNDVLMSLNIYLSR